MSNFLDLDTDEVPVQQSSRSDLKQLLAQVPISQPPTRLHPEISDRLAAQHGFSSRDTSSFPRLVGGKRQPRGVSAEETRQLSIRMPTSLYNDFLSFADSQRFTYNEAIRYLLDQHGRRA